MWSNLDATVYVERPTQIEYQDGHFIVTDQFGGTTLRRCYPPSVYVASLACAQEALAMWKLDTLGGNVVNIAAARK